MNIPDMVLEAVDHMTEGKFEKSERLLKRILRKDPENFDAIHAYALVDIGKSQPARGMKKLKRLAASADAQQEKLLTHSISMAHKGLGNLEAAVECFRTVYNARPDAYEAGMNLANCLEELGQYEEAGRVCRLILGTFADDVDASYLAACCKYGQGNEAEALDDMLKLGIKGNLGLSQYLRVSEKLEHHYRYDDLRQLAGLGLQKYPDSVPLAVYIARCDLEKKDYQGAIARLEQLGRGQIAPEEASELFHELGQIHDKLGDYASAYTAFKICNEQQRIQYKRKRIKKFRSVEPQRLLFENDNFVQACRSPERAESGRDLCFLIGFPRSGTTLLERVLDSHSAIHALPELDFTAQMIESLGGMERYTSKLAGLGGEDIEALDSQYRSALAELTPEQSPLTIDKLPLNLIHVPLIHRVFPAAKFILALRHPADCTLSCFMQNFTLNGELAYFLSLEDATHRYADVFALWNIYQEHLPLRAHLIRYEDLVEDFEQQTQSLMDFLELPYEAAQAKYHENVQQQGGVQTPSYRQVSKPIYKSSSYRWKNYEFAMAEYLPVLQPFIEQFGYAE